MRGLLQGNPLAAYFFIILFQPLLEKLRGQLELEEKMFAHADDLILMLKSIWRLARVLPTYYLYGKASGCNVHLGKSGWVFAKEPTEKERDWWRQLPERLRGEGRLLEMVRSIKNI